MTETEAISYVRNQINDSNKNVFTDDMIRTYIKLATQEISTFISLQGCSRYEKTLNATNNSAIDYSKVLVINRVVDKDKKTPLYESRDYASNDNCFSIADGKIYLSSNVKNATISYLGYIDNFTQDALLQNYILKYAIIQAMEKINLDFTAEAGQLQQIKQEAYASIKGSMQPKPNIFNVRR